MHLHRKYSSDGHSWTAIEKGLIVTLLSIAALVAIPTVKDHLSKLVTNTMLNLKAS